MKTTPLTLAGLCAAAALLGACGDTTADSCALSYTTTTSGSSQGLVLTTFGGDELAQSFKLDSSEADTTTGKVAVSKILLKLKKVGTLADTETVTLSLREDSSGPTGTELASTSIKVSTIGTTEAFETFTITEQQLTPDTTYWIRIKGSWAQSTTDLVHWMSHDDSTGGYSDGEGRYESSTADQFETTQTGTNVDFNFKVGCP